MIRIYTLILISIFAVSCKEKETRNQISPNPDIQQKTQNSNDTINNLLRVDNPLPGQLITSPFQITGEARGYWFFEANAPAELIDGNLQKISETYITVNGDWMTTEWVSFSGTLTFEKPTTGNGFLILHKANASGLKEHDLSDTIPIKF